jgi:ribosomal protein S6
MIDLVAFSPVRSYELTCLVEPALTDTELSSIKDAIDKLVKKYQGSVISQEDWGRKPLAYTIRAHKKAFNDAMYLHWVLSFEATQAQAFEHDIYLNNDVIRHLFVITENQKDTNK